MTPSYDYKCSVCGIKFELFESMLNDKPKDCPNKHKRKSKRLLGNGNFLLKGKGFYNTDYRN
jgi:putative FmdB family regulatory protein